MKLLSLEFNGFGPYTEAQSLKFPTARKVAILGTNGAGKTFLLDTVPACLFKSVPNRTGGFYEQFSGNDAMIDLTFEMGGSLFRARRLINANSRIQKAFLWKDGEALNDGKDAAFAAEIQKLGFNEMAFMAALYQTQNGAGNALNMRVDDRIKLLSIILDLLKFDEDHEKVVEAHKTINRTIDDLGVRRDELTRQLPNTEELIAQKTYAHADIDGYDKQIQEVDQQIEAATQSVANAKANAQGIDYLKTQQAQIQTAVAADAEAEADKSLRIQNNVELIINRAAEIRESVEKTDFSRLVIEAQQAEIERFRGIADKAQARLEEWNGNRRLETIAATQKHDEARTKLMAIEGELRTLETDKTKLQSSRTANDGRIIALRPSTEIMDRVPCKSSPQMHSSCELLKNARENVQTIARIELESADLDNKIVEVSAQIDQKKIEVQGQQNDVAALNDALRAVMAEQPPAEIDAELSEMTQKIAAANQLITDSNEAIRKAEPLAKLAEKLEGAEEKVAEYRVELAVITARLTQNRESLVGILQKIKEASDLQATIDKAEGDKSRLQFQRKQIESLKEQRQAQIGQLDALLSKAGEIKAQVEGIKAEITEHAGTLAEVQILRDGLGPKGAKNVKIDAAGKAITERANRLIRVGLGPQFSIVINTLRELQTKDENGDPEVRETLELKIINNDTGEEMLIENLSGGEKAMAGLVFSLSLAVEQREASGLDIRTLILDEPSAGLSEENSIKYLDMLDAVLDETGLEQVFFISHMPTMQNLADASIFVRKGQEGESSKVEVRA